MLQHPFMFLLRSWVTGGAGNVRKNCSLAPVSRSQPQTTAKNIGQNYSLAMISFFWILTLLFSNKALAVTFEQMLAGFEKCEFKDVYVDIFTKKPAHSYFIERQLNPCEYKDSMANFCINESYHGLPVYKLMIPAGTFDVHAIFIDLPIDKARKMAKIKFGTEFRRSGKSDDGERPALIPDPVDPKKSILTCGPGPRPGL